MKPARDPILFVVLSVCCLLGTAAGVSAGTIQEAIDAAGEGSVVAIPAGTYFECVTLKDGMTLLGAGADSTVIDGGDGARTVTCGKNTAIIGCTVRGGRVGVDNNRNYIGVFECKVLDNAACGISMRGGAGVIANNWVASHAKGTGIVCADSNPFIVRNRITDSAVGLDIHKHQVSTVVSNAFVGNRIAMRVGPDASAIAEANVFHLNTQHDVLGQVLGETNTAAPAAPSFPGKTVEEYRALMAGVFPVAAEEHPLVIYSLPKTDRGRFGVATLFPWATFTMSASASNTVIESFDAYDLQTRDALFAEYREHSGLPGVSVHNLELKEQDLDRYVLEMVYNHGPSYVGREDGTLAFHRTTSLTRVEILVPEGYRPVSCNYPMTLDTAGEQFLVRIADFGVKTIKLEMVPIAEDSPSE